MGAGARGQGRRDGRNPLGLEEAEGVSEGAEVSDRNANYVIAHPGATARDVLRLIDLVRSRVKEVSGVELEVQLTVW